MHLVAVNQEAMCLDYIGNTRSKVCLATKGCDKRSHERDRFVFPDGVNDLVFIQTGANNPTAWASPFVELSWFGSTWDRYRSETRSVTQWQTF